MAKKQFDPKAKAKRQKVIAAVGGVLLVGLLAFQIPRTMKMLHQQQTPAETTPAATTPSSSSGTPVSLAPPSLSGSPSSSGTSTAHSDGLSDPDAAPQPASGQLVSFGRFQSKDPFKQQVKTDCADCASSGSGSGSSVPKTPVVTPTQRAVPAGTPAASRSRRVTSATISVNGVSETVSAGGTFPKGDPVFELVSVSRDAAKISIVNGSYESGAATVTLRKGKTLTLMNTADGSRYQLRLVAVS